MESIFGLNEDLPCESGILADWVRIGFVYLRD